MTAMRAASRRAFEGPVVGIHGPGRVRCARNPTPWTCPRPAITTLSQDAGQDPAGGRPALGRSGSARPRWRAGCWPKTPAFTSSLTTFREAASGEDWTARGGAGKRSIAVPFGFGTPQVHRPADPRQRPSHEAGEGRNRRILPKSDGYRTLLNPGGADPFPAAWSSRDPLADPPGDALKWFVVMCSAVRRTAQTSPRLPPPCSSQRGEKRSGPLHSPHFSRKKPPGVSLQKKNTCLTSV